MLRHIPGRHTGPATLPEVMTGMFTLNRMSVAAFVVLVCAISSLIMRHSLIANGIAGITIQAMACALMLWARFTFGKRSFHASASPTEGGIITSGPYRYIRHPIYAAVLYFTWAGVLTHISIINVVVGCGAALGVAGRIFAEEKLLLGRYPEYAGYALRTKRIIPTVF